MKPALLICREAIESDLAAICALGEEVNAVHHDAFPHIFAGPGDADRDVAHWKRSIGQDNATTIVAEAQGVLVGFVTVGMVSESHHCCSPCASAGWAAWASPNAIAARGSARR
ncbi:hypothetical protein [Xanthomonas sacchari]|uniref:hypothetical protein n=1 Tax=Xanthomonas sacchari TaxID=56458 RepID=UPI00031BF94B|nr:hypothetical protein [Xanthomonas sacchari]MDV0436821.1 hypothetical protein [Xanthomonas sacchari]